MMLDCDHSCSEKLFFVNGYNIVFCKKCGFRKTFPIPKRQDLADIYDKNFYSGNDSRRFGDIGEMLVRFFRFLRAFKAALFYFPKRVLDVGCGRALMLYYLKKYFKAEYVIGTQYCSASIAYAKKKFGIDVKKGELADNIGSIEKNLDLICFWHVLEHIDDVETYIKLSYQLLKKGGKLLIEVPNSESFSAKISKNGWMGWDTPNHLTHFTPDSLAGLLENNGFKIFKKKYFSAEYSVFTTMQSLLNKISGEWNYFYKSLLVGKDKQEFSAKFIGYFLLAVCLAPLAIIANLIFYNSRQGEVIHYVAEKV
ncbi:MAG: class I SAM-dependent methyltransferase [Candidatus Omnitrophica bacterium]|nr:class I SAM-dependent methyltransferase [Candidatus Omnitrophota bacterium]